MKWSARYSVHRHLVRPFLFFIRTRFPRDHTAKGLVRRLLIPSRLNRERRPQRLQSLLHRSRRLRRLQPLQHRSRLQRLQPHGSSTALEVGVPSRRLGEVIESGR